MAYLGRTSLARLETCHPDLQRVVRLAISRLPGAWDLTVLCGHRDEAAQNAAFARGRSKLQWPRSKHNTLPSLAVDLAPYPVDWRDTLRFGVIAGAVLAAASELGVRIRWGGDWNRNARTLDETFQDLPHFELVQ